jgi:hypothetical protein
MFRRLRCVFLLAEDYFCAACYRLSPAAAWHCCLVCGVECASACVCFFWGCVQGFFVVFIFLFCIFFLAFLCIFSYLCSVQFVLLSLLFVGVFMLSSAFPFGSRVLRAPSVFSLSGWLVGRGCSSVAFRLSVRSVSGFVAVCSFSSFGAARAFSLRAAQFVGLFCVVRRVGAVWSVSVPAVLPSGVAAPVGVALAPAAWLGVLSAARRRGVSSPSFS